ncbi:DUF1176 domain-containing protein [Massilia sp. H6]|uniref:DUF1176 domain-containing protein n=1 Tax=Massilia sp. H6 TaxID=2970464 RepID=UPI0021680A31|nr:DUF1176 domain-containing protein [Massilia sp. H6]UVW30207.1 DUF1176 domain-containing protein [Massilia sp. H6]
MVKTHPFIALAVVMLATVGATFAAGAAAAGGLAHARYQHLDWELSCDNTRTCYAAGYHVEEGEPTAASVLLVRKAGPGAPVSARFQVGTYGEDETAARLSKSNLLTMRINGRVAGTVAVDRDTMIADLSRRQAEALVAALAGKATLDWEGGGMHWSVSGKGAAAVLLKMDEFQGRLGTPGALVRKGGRPEALVAPALAAPVVEAALVPPATPHKLPRDQMRLLLGELYSATGGAECEDLADVANGGNALTVVRLSHDRLLVSARCWAGAYNAGAGYWVVNAAPPYAPVLVTTQGTAYADGVISATHKGRGLGDCRASDEWVWDGMRFVHSAASTGGMCRLVAPGGAWHLPVLVTKVRRFGG